MANNDASSNSVSSGSSSESRFRRFNRKFRNTFRKTWSLRARREGMTRQRSHSDIGIYGLTVDQPIIDESEHKDPPTPGHLHHSKTYSDVTEYLSKQAAEDILRPNVTPLVIEDPPTESDGSSDDGSNAKRNTKSSSNPLIGMGSPEHISDEMNKNANVLVGLRRKFISIANEIVDVSKALGSSGNFSSVPGTLLGVSSGTGGSAPRSAPPTPHQQLEAPLRSPSHATIKYDKNGKNNWSEKDAGAAEGPLAPQTNSKSRQKKFNRHFPQATQDERVLNYYSCALVGDILLQGHLYITRNYFAFYSNVFGYVTKLLIPTATVVQVSKEKMVGFIPNAIGVTTSEDKHVFASLLTRDTTFKLMTEVWKASPTPIREVVPISKELRLEKPEFEASEVSLDDESSWCSQSGGEESNDVNNTVAGTQLTPPTRSRRASSPRNSSTELVSPPEEAPSEKVKLRSIKESLSENALISSVIANRKSAATIVSQNGSAIIQPSKINSSSESKSFSSILEAMPKHSTLLIVATILLVIMFLSAGLLLYRIGIVKDKLGHSFALEDNVLFLKRGDDFYSEIIKWQSQLHSKSALQVNEFLNSNLEQITKVRQSLETLSSIIGGITKLPTEKNRDNILNSDKQETFQTTSSGKS